MTTFHVLGLSPAPQGSKRHVGGGRMIESSAKVKPWREAVRSEALATGLAISAEPIYLHLLFRFRRPQGHRNAKGEIDNAISLHIFSDSIFPTIINK